MSADEALERVLRSIAGPTEGEWVHLADALDRVVAEPVESVTDLPPWDNSAMDGYALRSADVARATDEAPVTLRVDGDIAAGDRKSTRLNSSHIQKSRMPSSA